MAQTPPVTFGVTGGTPIQTPLAQAEKWMPFAVGPTVTVRVLSHLSLESGVMFHRLGDRNNSATFLYPENSVTFTYASQKGWALEVPLLAKVLLRGEGSAWRPFVTAGPALRRTSMQWEYFSTTMSGNPLSGTSAMQGPYNVSRSQWRVDPEIGAGLSVRAGRRFHVEPQVRYSYWGSGTMLLVRKNQVTALVGFRF